MPESVKTDDKHAMASNGLRIFRAIEEIAGVETTADFIVYPFLPDW